MYFSIKGLLSHKNWRKLVKKTRRKLMRKKNAVEREKIIAEEFLKLTSNPAYLAQQLEEKEIADEIERREKLADQHKREVWQRRDLALHTQWLQNKERKNKLELERKLQEETIRKEWDAKISLEKAVSKKKTDTENALLKEATKQLGANEATHNPDPPPGYVRPPMSKAESCPFFTKTGACRFGFNCSREHVYPMRSKTILLPNMYTHFGLHGALTDDYDTDISLEYSESDSKKHFREFFFDILPEFEKCGKVIQLKICSNKSAHLKGNVYVQFEKIESAEIAYGLFNGRWYAGRQISCVFVQIEHWKPAICGLHFTNKCPKGDSCNFLHIYRNPGNAFFAADRDWFLDKQTTYTPRSERRRSQSRSNKNTSRRDSSDSSRSSDRRRERRRDSRSISREKDEFQIQSEEYKNTSYRSKKKRRHSPSFSREAKKSKTKSRANRKSRSRSSERSESQSFSREKESCKTLCEERKKTYMLKEFRINKVSRNRARENINPRSKVKTFKISETKSLSCSPEKEISRNIC